MGIGEERGRRLARGSLWRCLAALTLSLLWLFASAGAAGATELRGAQTHPLWSSSKIADFDRELDLLRDAGANTVRIDITWSSLQTAGKGRFSSWYVEKIDTFMRHAEARGIKVIPNFHATPCWASSAPESLKQGCEGDWWDRGVTKYPPKDVAEYAEAAAWVANRWGRYMAGFQVWNEPNESSQNFWKTSDQAGDYARLLKATYPVLKRAQPNLTVAAGALSFSDGRFTEKLYDLGIKNHFDVFSVHPYSESRPPTYTAEGDSRKWSFASGVPWIRKIMLAHGDDKPIWLTEWGWTSCTATSDYGRRRCVSREQQANYTEQAWEMLGKWDYVEAATQYNLRNKGTDPAEIEDQYGLVERDFTPKPAFRAFKDGLAGNARASRIQDESVSGPRPSVLDLADPETVRVSPEGRLRARIECPPKAASSCRGRLRLHTAEEVLAGGERRVVRLARTDYSIRRGTREVLELELPRAKRALVSRLEPVDARAGTRAEERSAEPRVAGRDFTVTSG